MSNRRKSWYLVSYDVRCPRRLRKLYRFLVDHGTPIQLSVFLVEMAPASVENLILGCQDIMVMDEDDLMVYQTDTPGMIWRYGVGDDLPVWQLGISKRRPVAAPRKPINRLLQLSRKLLWKD